MVNPSDADAIGTNDIRSWLYADRYLRDLPKQRWPSPAVNFWYREPGLWLPLSCAIALDTSTASHSGGDPSPYDVSVTVTGANPSLVVFVNTATDLSASLVVSYPAGVTTIAQLDKVTVSGTITLYSYLLIGASTGTNTLRFAYSGTPQIYYVASSYTGTSQTGAPSTPDAHSTNAIESGLITVADNCWLVAGARDTNDSALSASTGATALTNDANYFGGFYTAAAQTPAGSHTMLITHTGTLKSVELSLAPVGGGGGGLVIPQIYHHLQEQGMA